MARSSARAAGAPRVWRMPIAPESYDQYPHLRPIEADALTLLTAVISGGTTGKGRKGARRAITRLEEPFADVIALRRRHASTMMEKMRTVLRRDTARRGRPFWGWSEAEWLETICPDVTAFWERCGSKNPCRMSMIDAAYLLGGLTDLTAVGQMREMVESARAYFGSVLIEQELARLAAAFVGPTGLGYSGGDAAIISLRAELCRLFVLNRSPYLEDLSAEFLHDQAAVGTRTHSGDLTRSSNLRRITIGLERLGVLEPPSAVPAAPSEEYDTTGVAPEWARWCLAWGRRNTRLPHRRCRQAVNGLLAVGRWLQAERPDISSPEEWDEDLALDYVQAVCRMTSGSYISAAGARRLRAKGTMGQPLRPKGIDGKLRVLRTFFADVQDRSHAVAGRSARKIALRFKPAQVLATPHAIKRLIQPDPRDIDQALWYKLTYAAATLTGRDLPVNTAYPLSLYRAVALLWVTAGRRSDELARLRVGCIRRDWVPEMGEAGGLAVDDGTQTAAASLCYLHVPSGKTRGPFWVWVPGYTADALDAWAAERPIHQPPLLDQKDREMVDYLFCYRGIKMRASFINQSLIPTLCKRANIPTSDARGAITSHRARSTRATILRMLGVPLDDIAQYLGHADSRTVTRYARTNPLQLARTIQKASDLERIVDGVIDLQAVAEGRPGVRWWLGWDANGEPRYCGHPAWHTCAHRLECQKCSAFIGGEAARLLREGEDVIPIQARVPMTPVEKAAADGNVELFNDLLARLKDTPPPAPTSPGDIHNPMAFTPALATMMSREPAGDELAQLDQELSILMRSLVDAERAPTGRSVLLTSLKRKIESVRGEMAALESKGSDPDEREGRVS